MKKHLPVLILVACAAIFCGTFFILLKGRFEVGDVYPPSSSLRSDPLGTMALYESLEALPGLSVARDHSAVNRLPDGRDTTYLHFSADSGDWKSLPAETFRLVDGFLLGGGRLVVTLKPQFARPASDEKQSGGAKKKKDEAGKSEKKPGEEEEKAGGVPLLEKWGLNISVVSRKGPRPDGSFTVHNTSAPSLPGELKWHGDAVLSGSDASWKVIYAGEDGPVMAEKSRGAGTIVVATDSYFVSNEALVRDRHPDLLAWLVGPNHKVIFDEAHLGIMDSPGIAALARKYRLHGGAAVLVVLAGLFIWSSSSSLAPRREVPSVRGDDIAGRDATAGFVGLLRRNIPPDEVLGVCLAEWRKSFARGTRFSAREKAALETLAHEENARPARDRDPVRAYEKFRATLSRHSSKPSV